MLSKDAQEFDLSRVEGTVTGSFSLNGASREWFDSLRDRRNISLSMDYQWTRWQRFLNKFLRFMLWPVGPKPLPRTYAYEFPNAEITGVRISDYDDKKITTVDFRVPND